MVVFQFFMIVIHMDIAGVGNEANGVGHAM